MTEPLAYCVLLERSAPVAKLAEALAKTRGEPLADAARTARNCRGIVATGLAEPEARALGEGLGAGGVAALAVPQNLIEEPPPVRELARCEPRQDGLYWTPKGGQPAQLAPWSALTVVAAAAFKRSSARVVKTEETDLARRALGIGFSLATGLPPSLVGGGKKEVERRVENTEVVFYADFLFGPLRLRIDAQDFDFSGLGARMAYDAASNLKRFVTLALEARPAVPRSEGAAILGDNRPLRDMSYGELPDLEREEKWLCTLLALKKL